MGATSRRALRGLLSRGLRAGAWLATGFAPWVPPAAAAQTNEREQSATAREDVTPQGGPSLAQIALSPAGPPDEAPEALRREVTRLGLSALGPAFDLLEGGAPVPCGEDGHAGALSAARRAALVESLGVLPHEGLTGFLERRLRAFDHPPARRAALEVLLRHGRAEDLSLALRAATPRASGAPLDGELTAALGDTVLAVLKRDARAFPMLASLYPESRGGQREELVRAAGEAGSSRALPVLASFLASRSELDVLVVTHIGRVASGVLHPVGEDVCARVRRLLDDGDPDLRREAALALGRLEDCEAIPRLIEMLESDRRGPSEAAHWALKRITALRFSADPRVWRGWLEVEEAWRRDSSLEAIQSLSSSDPAQVHAAVSAIGGRRLRRHDLARELAKVRAHSSRGMQIAVCNALGQLRSGAGVPRLIDHLSDGDPSVRLEAWRALKAITGKDLPPDPAAWDEILP